MARIKKKGLDYFPLNTDFIHDRAVRRLMKREGDSALSILIEVLSYIYAGEGYYVHADRLFYEDLSAGLYEKSADDVERVIRLAVEYGLFDAGLFERGCILTSVEIQRQYLFSTRRRSASFLEAGYCLLANEEMIEDKEYTKGKAIDGSGKSEHDESISEGDNVAFIPNNVTLIPENVTSSTHSIAQNSTAEHSVAEQKKEYPHFNSPLETAGEKTEKPEKKIGEEEFSPVSSCGRDNSGSGKRKIWTQETIDRLLPPADGALRNYGGLLDNLRSYGIPPSEQYAIILKSNFGAIGGAIWRGLATLRGSGGKIKLPGRYLLSVVNRKEEIAIR
ncbi:DUF4373 domain-containing protein [Bacteroides faecium]|uniref:DUF4373 domain-containing protein n=1 Tax=Bacteroides faecium TaxID=2715212 RepID=A0A6H0KJF5_9BACE|nr:DUF4373 domain-containing protein [Bacteroides faecium]QIU93566.1 DUF4373 domain-containing protein [Bacteroides faecium]